jgi:hypothetical protein
MVLMAGRIFMEAQCAVGPSWCAQMGHVTARGALGAAMKP